MAEKNKFAELSATLEKTKKNNRDKCKQTIKACENDPDPIQCWKDNEVEPAHCKTEIRTYEQDQQKAGQNRRGAVDHMWEHDERIPLLQQEQETANRRQEFAEQAGRSGLPFMLQEAEAETEAEAEAGAKSKQPKQPKKKQPKHVILNQGRIEPRPDGRRQAGNHPYLRKGSGVPTHRPRRHAFR
jgi:hypothetical protein